MGELLLNDYSRRGFLDGIGIRLPTICIRPGLPNKAASGFFSNILREPLAGKRGRAAGGRGRPPLAREPARRDRLPAPRHDAATGRLGARRCLSMPGLSATVGEQIEALRRAAGDAAVALIRREPDPTIARIVAGWPARFDAGRATASASSADASFDAIIAAACGGRARRGHRRRQLRQPSAVLLAQRHLRI